MSIILFLLLLTFLILIHELGHFFVARWSKIKIEEFGIGLPPKALTLFTWRGIPFTLNWIFLGGFVRMEGEDQASADRDQGGERDRTVFPFYTRPLLQKLAVVAAGPAVNFLFGIVAFIILYSVFGIPKPVLQEVAPGSPAAVAGLQSGDVIHGIRTQEGRYMSVVSNEQVITKINARRGQEVWLSIERLDQHTEQKVYVRKTDEIPEGQGAIGIVFRPELVYLYYPFIQQAGLGIVEGLRQSIDFGLSVLTSLGTLAGSLGHGNVPAELSGPVGIAYEVQRFRVFSAGVHVILNFAALLSINLAIMNILPIPALDGGRIVLLILEKFFPGKRFATLSGWLNTGGFVILLGLLLLITLKDVFKIVFS